MKISVLASGSRGNCTYIEYKNTKILIDMGVSLSYIQKKLKEINVDVKHINAVIITHTHSDHIYGLTTFCKKNLAKIYITKGMEEEICHITQNYYIINEVEDVINDFSIQTVPTSHDAPNSVGFIIKTENRELVYITDTGYINMKQFPKIKNKDMYILESNHDIELLMNGKYPYHLKQRILSDIGHLSNKDCAMYLSELAGNKTKCIVLAHLSEENNNEEMALTTLKEKLNNSNKKIDRIYVAKPSERTELIEI